MGCLCLTLLAVCGVAFHRTARVRHVDFDINDAVDMCGAALHTLYSREFDIAVFDKSDAFSRLLQWLAAGTKVRSRYKWKFELSEFDITRFDCTVLSFFMSTSVHSCTLSQP